MRSLGAVGSTIHSMIKFPTNQGIVTMETSRKAPWECRQLEKVQGPVPLRKTGDRENTEEIITISHEHPNQYVTMGAMLIADCKQLLAGVLRENRELKEGMIRKVQHPVWVANTIPVKLANRTWKAQVDYSSLNKVCANDMYLFLEEGEELASIMGYPYKYFLRLPKEYSQIRMAEDDEEKNRFHTKEGVYCFTYMPKELKNSTATLQRMMEKVLADQRGRKVEIFLEEIVIKCKNERDLVQDVEEILRKLKSMNIKIDPIMSSFGVKEGRFLGHIVANEGEAKGLVVKKFFGQGEQVQETTNANERETFNLSKKLQTKSTPTLRAWRLYLGKETIKEGSGVGIILVTPNEKMHSHVIRLKFKSSDHAINCEELLAGLAASVRKGTTPFHNLRITHLPKILNPKTEVLTGLATIKLEFLNQEVSVGIKTRPSVEDTSSSKKGKAVSNVPGAKPNYNWEASRSN
ncbi:hypothetical protein Tco_1216529 [Tanacetum coccineum]